MSAHFLAWPRCMNIQAGQPYVELTGACRGGRITKVPLITARRPAVRRSRSGPAMLPVADADTADLCVRLGATELGMVVAAKVDPETVFAVSLAILCAAVGQDHPARWLVISGTCQQHPVQP